MSGPHELYQEGKLDEAIEALGAAVKSRPTDVNARGFLAELLCFAGNHARVDVLLDQMQGLDNALAVPLALFRQLLRADLARQQFYEEGRLPEFIGKPEDWVKLSLEASIALREGKADDAAKLLVSAEEQRPRIPGTRDGKPFDDIRDLDDLLGGIVEVYTTNGKFYWIPLDRVIEAEFRPSQRPRDLLWRHAHMIVKDGPEGDVYLPALYYGSAKSADQALRLGRGTDWVGEGPVRGVGQRCFLIGEEDVPILEITSLSCGTAE
jgi:type VI secretion system protein ImpE